MTLDKIFSLYFNFAHNNKDFFRLILALHFTPPESPEYKIASEIHQEQFVIIEKMFKKASEQHGNMRNRHTMYAMTLMGFINNYIGIALSGYANIDDSLRRKAIHQFQHGIYS